MKEIDFIRELEQRAVEQRKLAETELMPAWARGMGEWLAIHPWRVVAPLAASGYLGLRIMLGEGMRELVLSIFGGFR